MDVTIVSQNYSANNWQQEVCQFLNAGQNNVKTLQMENWDS